APHLGVSPSQTQPTDELTQHVQASAMHRFIADLEELRRRQHALRLPRPSDVTHPARRGDASSPRGPRSTPRSRGAQPGGYRVPRIAQHVDEPRLWQQRMYLFYVQHMTRRLLEKQLARLEVAN